MKQFRLRWANASAPFALLSLLVSGCSTSLTSTQVSNFSAVSKGQVYYLARAEYQVTVSRELKRCTTWFSSDADAALFWLADQLEAAKSQDTDALRLKHVNAVIADSILQAADVKRPIEELLFSNWPSEVVKREAHDAFLKRLNANKPKLPLQLEAMLTAQAAGVLAPDTAKTYSLDYELMQSGLKGTDYSVEMYPNGTLKAVNITIDDQTGSAIQSAIGGIAKLAAATGGFPLTQVQGAKANTFQSFADWKADNSDKRSLCKPDIRLKMFQRAGLEAQADSNAEELLAQSKLIDKLEKAEVKAIAEHDRAKAALKELDKNDPKYPETTALVEKTGSDVKIAKKKALDAKASFEDLGQAAGKVSARLAALRKALTHTTTFTARPIPTALSFRVGGEDEAMKEWLHEAALSSCATDSTTCGRINEFSKAISAFVDFYAPDLPHSSATEPSKSGIFYRQPLRSLLLVCKATPCVSPPTPATPSIVTATPASILLNTGVDVPQLGALAVLPLHNVPFQNNTIGVAFAENGALTKVTYKSNAAVSKAAEVFESSADTVLKYKEAKRLQESTKLETAASELASRKKVIEAQLALEKAQADLDKFRASQEKPSE